MLPLRLGVLSVLAIKGVAAQYHCAGLADQEHEHIFRTQLVPGDASSVFTGNMSYACNLTTGGVTYRQNLLVSFVDPADPNSTMTVSANLSISAAGCTGRAGVHVNYTIGVEYPLSFWEAFTAPDTTVGRFLDPNLKRSMLVVNGTTFTDMDPEFSLATLAAMAGEGVACNAPPPPGPVPVGAPAPPDCAQNVSGLLAQTGTDITFKLKSIEGSSQAQKSTPGVAFGMSATISVLSQKNSKICAGEDAFCCATFDKDGKCCCNPDEISAFCGSDANTFVSAQCSSDTGQTKQCSDAVCPVVNAKDDCTKNPSLFRSECAAFKLSVYNFTMGLPTSGAPTGGARVDVFPSDPVSSVVEFDLLEYFYGELCVHGNDCPGQETTGKAWLSGDKTGGAKPPGVVKIGPNANGEIGDCDGAINRLLRHVGVVGFVFLTLGLIALLVGLGYVGYLQYQKRQQGKQFPSLDASLDVAINDPGAGTSADFNYADIDSVIS